MIFLVAVPLFSVSGIADRACQPVGCIQITRLGATHLARSRSWKSSEADDDDLVHTQFMIRPHRITDLRLHSALRNRTCGKRLIADFDGDDQSRLPGYVNLECGSNP